MKLSIVVPVYNEKNTITKILKTLSDLSLGNIEKEIIVIDDGSGDGTKEIIKGLPESYKTVIHDKNYGKGWAIRNGLKEVTGDYVVIQDADMEYDPNDFKEMINKMISEDLKVLYGSRRLKKDNTQYSGLWYYFGGWVLTLVANILYDQKLTDEPTCYKMFRSDFIKSLPLQCSRFEFCPEVTALSALQGVKIQEVPIFYHPRSVEQGKKIGWKDAFTAMWVLLKYRFISIFNKKFMQTIYDNIKKNKIILLLGLVAVVNLIIFKSLFGFHPNNDTDGFIYTIQFFKGDYSVPLFANRYLNPFYAVVGSTLFFFLSAVNSLILTNIIFYFGLVFLTYGLMRRVFKNDVIGFISSTFIMTSYAMIRYGLTQIQDIGGYFWFLLTIYSGWRWRESGKLSWLYLSSVAVSFGVLTKESGSMGALFVGMIFLFSKISWPKKISSFVNFSILPFITILINALRSKDVGVNSAQWFVYNWKRFAETNFTFLRWFGVHTTSYNFLWVLIVIGIIYLIKNWRTLDADIKIYLIAVIPSSLSYYGWSLFIARTVFISAWLFVPIAAYGVYQVYLSHKKIAVTLLVLAILSPYVLQITIRYAPLFLIIDSCHKNISCSVNYFINNWKKFSLDGEHELDNLNF